MPLKRLPFYSTLQRYFPHKYSHWLNGIISFWAMSHDIVFWLYYTIYFKLFYWDILYTDSPKSLNYLFLAGYSLIYNPWYCLIFEAMESVTTSLSFTAAVTYAAKLSTTTTDSSIQGLLGGLYFGVGKSTHWQSYWRSLINPVNGEVSNSWGC